MPLDGLRAWIGEFERKLGARTRVGLVLVALAIGGAGAGIYLALDAASNSISKDDLQTLEEQAGSGIAPGTALESGVGTVQAQADGTAAEVAKLKLQVKLLQTQVKSLTGEDSGSSSSDGIGVPSIPEDKAQASP